MWRAVGADREARLDVLASEDAELQHTDDGDRTGVGLRRLQAAAQHRYATRMEEPDPLPADGDRRAVRRHRIEGLRGTRPGRQPGVAGHVLAGADRSDPAR